MTAAAKGKAWVRGTIRGYGEFAQNQGYTLEGLV